MLLTVTSLYRFLLKYLQHLHRPSCHHLRYSAIPCKAPVLNSIWLIAVLLQLYFAYDSFPSKPEPFPILLPQGIHTWSTKVSQQGWRGDAKSFMISLLDLPVSQQQSVTEDLIGFAGTFTRIVPMRWRLSSKWANCCLHLSFNVDKS